MKLLPDAHVVKHVIQEPLESWYHSSKKVLILGEAVHSPNVSINSAVSKLSLSTVYGSLKVHIAPLWHWKMRLYLAVYFLIYANHIRSHISSQHSRIYGSRDAKMFSAPNWVERHLLLSRLAKNKRCEMLSYENSSLMTSI